MGNVTTVVSIDDVNVGRRFFSTTTMAFDLAERFLPKGGDRRSLAFPFSFTGSIESAVMSSVEPPPTVASDDGSIRLRRIRRVCMCREFVAQSYLRFSATSLSFSRACEGSGFAS
jgi:hypothetical protein